MSWKRYIVIVLLSCGMAGGAIGGVRARVSPGERVYFSPDTLETRFETERLLPFWDVAISRRVEGVRQWPVVQFLVAQGYWTPSGGGPARWVETSRTNRRWRDGTSWIELQLGGHGGDWVGWSNAHPELARYFWPKLLERLRRGDEGAVREAGFMLIGARQSGSVGEFERVMAE